MNMDEQQLPPGWELVTINDLCAINPKHIAGIPDETPVSFVPMAAVSDVHGRIETPEVRSYGEVKRGFTHFADGDVIFAKITPCMENGKAASVRGLVNGLGCGTTEFFVFRSHGALSQDYLFHFIRQESYRKLARAQMQSGVGQARVPREFIEDTEIPIPPLPEQRRIVAKIEALQERSGRAAKALEEVGPLLEQFRQSILAAAFSGRLTADWREKNPNVEPAHELLARIRTERRQRWLRWETFKYESRSKKVPKNLAAGYEEPEPLSLAETAVLPGIPETWCWANIDQVGIVGSGKRLPKGSSLVEHDTGFPYIRAGNLKDGTVRGQILFLTAEDHEEISQYTVNAGDNYLTIVGASIGDAGTIPKEFEGANLTENAAKVMSLVDSNYLGYVLRSPPLQEQIQSKILSAAQGKLALGRIKQMLVPVPPVAEQLEIASLVTRLLKRISDLCIDTALHESELNQLNQSILAKAFRGELVPQDPNDEPASELLARIRRGREVSGDRVQGSGRKKKAAGKGDASESARPAKRSKRSPKAASATTPDTSADASPEPARPQRRRRRSSSNSEDASLVIRVLAEGGAVNIHADTSGPQVLFYTKSSGGGLMAEIEGITEADLQPRESKRVANLSDLMEPDLALLYPNDINETYLPQLRNWYTWAAPQLPEHFENEFLEQAKSRWSEALQIEEPSTSQAAIKAKRGRLFEA